MNYIHQLEAIGLCKTTRQRRDSLSIVVISKMEQEDHKSNVRITTSHEDVGQVRMPTSLPLFPQGVLSLLSSAL
jgi:hypothetical protein